MCKLLRLARPVCHVIYASVAVSSFPTNLDMIRLVDRWLQLIIRLTASYIDVNFLQMKLTGS
jgi:hypothetical protein